MSKGWLGLPASGLCPGELERDEGVDSRGQGAVYVLARGFRLRNEEREDIWRAVEWWDQGPGDV